MAFVANRNQDEFLNAQKDEEKQDEAIRTSTAGDIGAESTASTVSGQSVRPSDQARQPQRAASQVLTRNQGKAANPFQFDQTRQALTGAKGKIQTEKDQYMSNAVAPYQTGQQLTGQVQQYAREGGATPEWLQKYQQGTPQALGAFSAQTNTNFAPVNAMQTNAGVRSYLRNPADPESRSGEQAIDFSLLNADPNFNLQREGVLRDYSDLDRPWEPIGKSPISEMKVPHGFKRWKVALPGYEVVNQPFNLDDYAHARAPQMPELSLEERRGSFREVALGIDEAMIQEECKRCLRCDLEWLQEMNLAFQPVPEHKVVETA
jgi:hypothetical protein